MHHKAIADLNFYLNNYNQNTKIIGDEFIIKYDITNQLRFTSNAGVSMQANLMVHLLDLPVVDPNSFPNFCILSPISPSSSVGNGPDPTLVQ